jgi:hypothetical protein
MKRLKTPKKVCFCFLKNFQFFKKQKQTTPFPSLRVGFLHFDFKTTESCYTPQYFLIFRYGLWVLSDLDVKKSKEI